MSERERLIREVQARAKAAGKAVCGYSSTGKGACAEAKGSVPDDWDRLCAEGDPRWTHLPAKEATKG